jgi:SAM-dependent methyltransferase
LISAETANNLVLRLAGGNEHAVLRGDIRAMTPLKLSMMPTGFEAALKPQDMADLLRCDRLRGSRKRHRHDHRRDRGRDGRWNGALTEAADVTAKAAHKQERLRAQRFEERYAQRGNSAARAIECAVIGYNGGANGYTTLRQAEGLGRALGLRPGMRMLDIGSGRGWPAIYLAEQTGCDAVMLDVPLEGLRVAARRARSKRLHRRVRAVRASASSMPFAPGSFDAIVSTDTLC